MSSPLAVRTENLRRVYAQPRAMRRAGEQDVVAVNSSEELQALLTGGFQNFLDWRERAFAQLGLNSPCSESSPSA